jgi:NADPH2:quinone reductase
MKAIIVRKFGDPSVLTLEADIPIPKPQPNEFLIKIHSVGLNPVETYQRSGNYTPAPTLPWIPGRDASGTIEAIGSNVVSVLKPGSRVWLSNVSSGTYAQYATAPAEGVHLLPDNITFEQGTLWTAYGTAYHALVHIGEVKAGETVLVHGASGGVGLASVQLAKSFGGLKIIGTAGTERGADIVKLAGAEAVFNHKEANYTDKILEYTQGKGVDVILEMTANLTLLKSMNLLAKNGRICVIGNRGIVDGFNARVLMQKRASIRGVMLFQITPEERAEIIHSLNEKLLNKWINPVIHKSYPLALASKAHEEIINPPTGSFGKLILSPWEE